MDRIGGSMNLYRCINKHFFSDMYSFCPTCGEPPLRTVGTKERSEKAEEKDKHNLASGIENVNKALEDEKERKNFFWTKKKNEVKTASVFNDSKVKESSGTISIFTGGEPVNPVVQTVSGQDIQSSMQTVGGQGFVHSIQKPTEPKEIVQSNPTQSGFIQTNIPQMSPVTSNDVGKTVSYFNSSTSSEPTVGWIVILSGSQRGLDFPIYSGKNAIFRRGADELICTNSNVDVSKAELLIIYDPKSKQFIGQSVVSDCYVNGISIENMTLLNDRDKLALGNITIDIVFLCNSEFDWKVE